jgi:hypothetical protein
MIEQLGMGWGLSEDPHIIDRWNDAAAEQVVPDAIRGDASGQRASDYLPSQPQPTTSNIISGNAIPTECLEKTSVDRITRRIRVASNQQ